MFGFSSKEASAARETTRGRYTGCFGKLPAYPEFIRHNLSTRESLAMDLWVQEGVSLMTRSFGEGWKGRFLAAPPLSFLLVGNRETHSVAGVIAPSQDKGGRVYPFGIFGGMDEPIFGDMQTLAVVGFAEFIEHAQHIANSASGVANVREVVASVEDSLRTMPRIEKRRLITSEMETLGRISMGKFWSELLPGADIEARAIFLKTVDMTLNSVARRTPNRVHWGIRLPLPSKGERLPYVTFWVQLAETVIGSRGWRAQCYWHGGQSGLPPRLNIFFKPVPSSYLVSLFDAGRSDGSVLDVIEEMEKNSEHEITRQIPFAKSEDMTLVDALNHWRNRDSFR